MGQRLPVRAGDVEFYVEVADGPAGAGGMQPVAGGPMEPLQFDGVRDTVRAIAGQLVEVWEAVAPDEARVEFSLALSARPGRLTGLLVEGGGEAALKVAMVWRRHPRQEAAAGD